MLASDTPKAIYPLTLGTANSSFLDLCRGMSASVVLLAHAQAIFHTDIKLPVTGGFGVVIFFLLSGFLITISMAKHLRKDDPDLHVFLSDRLARIATPFLPVLLIVAVADLVLIRGDWGQPGANRGLYALFGNAVFLADYPAFQAISNRWDISSYFIRPYNSAEPFWTVPIELWIYIFVGLVAFTALGKKSINPFFATAGFVLSLPVIIWNSFAGGGGALTLIWLLGAGFGLLWIFMRRVFPHEFRRIGLGLLLYGSICLAGRILKASFNPYEVQTAIFIACVMFGASFALEPIEEESATFGKLSRGLASYSYSLYLVHNTVLVAVYEHSRAQFVDFIVAVILAHIVAVFCYFLFEKHHKKISRVIQPLLSRVCYGDEHCRLRPASKVPS
jgi:peptidoglycan/LPS O-acetylase OafA/YrhL